MNEQFGTTEFDNLEPALDSAVQAVLAEPLPNDAVERVKARARRLSSPTVSSSKPGIGRRVWLVPAARYGGIAAAVMAIVAVAIFSLFTQRPSGRAFADVIQNVIQARSVQLTMTQRLGHQPENVGKMYFDENRLRIELFSGAMVHVGDLSQKRALYLDTHGKIAQSIAIDNQIAKEFANPIDQLRRAKTEDAENIGEEYLKGRLTQVYRIRQVDFLGMRGKAEMLVWVDPREGLPVKIVIHDLDPKAEMEIRFEDFLWNEPLDPNLFSLDVPDGYKKGTILPTPRPASSMKPPPPSRIDPSRLAEGILSGDRVPGRFVWGLQGTTITAIMRDSESVAPHDRRFNELRQWNVATGELNWSVVVHSTFSLAATADGKSLATVEGYELQLRDSTTGQVKQKWSTEKHVSPLAFSPDGKTLAAGIAEWGQQPSGRGQSGGVQFWDMEHGTLKRSLSDDKPTTFVRYSSDGKYLASAPNGGPVKVWDAATGELVRIFPYGGKFDFSPDGRLIACMASQPMLGDTADDVRKRYDVQIYELKTGKLMKTLVSDGHTKESYVLWIEFSPDGGLVAVANWDGTVKLWDVATGELKKTITEHEAGVGTCVFAPNGHTLATGSEDKILRLWNVQQLVSP